MIVVAGNVIFSLFGVNFIVSITNTSLMEKFVMYWMFLA